MGAQCQIPWKKTLLPPAKSAPSTLLFLSSTPVSFSFLHFLFPAVGPQNNPNFSPCTRGNTALSGPTGYHGESVQHLHTSILTITFHLKLKDQSSHCSSHRSHMQPAPTHTVHLWNFSLKMLMLCNCVDRRDQFESQIKLSILIYIFIYLLCWAMISL